MSDKPSRKAIFDALTSDSSGDSCDADWRNSVLERADPKDVKEIRQAFLQGGTENEVASRLDIWPR